MPNQYWCIHILGEGVRKRIEPLNVKSAILHTILQRQKVMWAYIFVYTIYRSYDPYMGHRRFFHCHAEKVGT